VPAAGTVVVRVAVAVGVTFTVLLVASASAVVPFASAAYVGAWVWTVGALPARSETRLVVSASACVCARAVRASAIRLSCVVTYWFVAPGVPLEPASAFF
jgi:hypothetical protein